MPGKLYTDDLAQAIKESGEKKYRPSNGTEGTMFMGNWCEQCHKELECQIIGLTMILDKKDEGYPAEWTYKDGQPVCTAFQEMGPGYLGLCLFCGEKIRETHREHSRHCGAYGNWLKRGSGPGEGK
jgi:hypothetical protein